MSQSPAPFAGAAFDVVVLAASAGGLNALSQVVALLPETFPAGLVVVQHLSPDHHSYLAEILARRTALHVKEAAAGDQVLPGILFVAPPNRHLLVSSSRLLLVEDTALVQFVRPSANRLFESAAACCRERTLGVVLSGSGSDGSLGARAIKRLGGTVLAQDPASADFRGMPAAAIATGCVDQIVPLARLGETIQRLVRTAN